MFHFIIFPSYVLLREHFVLSFLYLGVKVQQPFFSSSCMFLDKKTLFNNCVAEWRWVPGMSRGFHLWHGQPLDRVTPPWLANPRPPAMSPHANGTSQWKSKGRGAMGVKEWSKGQTKRVAARKTLYWAHGGDASKADRA